MAAFPETAFASYPLTVESSWKTLISDFESGKEQRRKRWAFPKRKISLRYDKLTPAGIKDIWQFYQARSGAYETFYLFVPVLDYWYGEYVGTGNNVLTTFDLPSKSTTEASVTVYVDGVSSPFTFVEGGGQEGSDRAIMSSAPGEGAILTADFYGKLRINGRFGVDNLSKELFDYLLFRAEIPILEVK